MADIFGYTLYGTAEMYRALTRPVDMTPRQVIIMRIMELYKFLGIRPRRVDGMVLSYDRLLDLYGLYLEIFCKKVYDFKAKNDKPLIIDAGANIGLATLRFKQLYPGARVLCFEPQASAFKMLTSNIEDNHLEGVEAFNVALSDHVGHIVMYVGKGLGADVGASIAEIGADREQQNIPCYKLSDIISEPVDLLKIDTEGSEYPILRDLDENEKLPLIDKLIIEYHPIEKNKYKRPILEILERNGYEYDDRVQYATTLYDNGLMYSIIYAWRVI